MHMHEHLFSEFSPVTKETWKQLVLKELKGQPYHTLLWEKGELTFEPYYTREEIAGFNLPVIKKPYSGWHIRQDFTVTDYKHANQKILRSLQNGINAIGIHLTSPCALPQLEILFDGVFLEMISVHFISGEHTSSVFEAFMQWAEKNKTDISTLTGSFHIAPLPNNMSDFASLAKLLHHIHAALPKFKLITICIGPTTAHEKISEELSLALQKNHQYFSAMSASGYDKKTLADITQWHVSIGVEYFLEIARLRAIRILWDRLLHEHQIEPAPVLIQAQKSWEHHDEKNPFINILRHTTEAMSAIIGGCDILTLPGANEYESLDQDFFERINTNIQHILKHESHFDAVADPAAGSYYIETLTMKLCDATWTAFSNATKPKRES
jgi:methylmalonyl-CoA mutase